MNSYQLYFHYKGNQGDHHTFLWRPEPGIIHSVTWQVLLETFVADYYQSRGFLLSAQSLSMRIGPEIELLLTSGPFHGPGPVINSCGNVDIVDNKGKLKQDKSKAIVTTTSLTAPLPTSVGKTWTIPELLKAADNYLKDGNLFRAKIIWYEVLRQEPKNLLALRRLASASYDTGKWEKAMIYFENIMEIIDGKGTAMDWLVIYRIHMKLNEIEKAESALHRARLRVLQSLVNGDVTITENDIDVEFGWLAVAQGNMKEASQRFLDVITHSSQKHARSLMAYGSLCYMHLHYEEALDYLLEACIMDQYDDEVRTLLAKVLDHPGLIEYLFSKYPVDDNFAQLYVYLGTSSKMNGAIDSGYRLTALAQRHFPITEYTQGVLELLFFATEYETALNEIVKFLKDNLHLRVGLWGVSCEEVLAALNQPSGQLLPCWTVPRIYCNGYMRYGYGFCARIRNENTSFNPYKHPPTAPVHEKGLMRFEATDYYQLSMYFLLVEILYVLGKLDRIPALIAVIEPTRVSSKKPIHEIVVHKHQSAYIAIAQTLALCPARIPYSLANNSCHNIYFCGDKQILAFAWNFINLEGQRHQIIPAFSLGLMHWHFTDEREYSHKENFRRLVEKIPANSTVVFVIGENDCRYSLVDSVNRGYFENAYEAMEHMISLFIKFALPIIQRRQLRAYFHPIVPADKGSAPYYGSYNIACRKCIDSIIEPAGSQWCLRWLDMLSLIAEPYYSDSGIRLGAHLLPEFEVNGEVLNPRSRYFAILERAIVEANEKEG